MGPFDAAVDDVKRTLTRLRRDERFAVYSQYRLWGSTSPQLPRISDRWPGTDGG